MTAPLESEKIRIAYHTFGCKANQYDTERIRQELEARGAETVGIPAGADLVVVNTCTVTNRADAEARRFIRRVRRERPQVEVLAVGCSTALSAADYERMPQVDYVVAGHDPVQAAEALGKVPRSLVFPKVPAQLNPGNGELMGGAVLLRRAGATRGWLKVQDGCDRKCSFCATRLARGKSRSRPIAEIVADARALSRTHPELVITGIHIGHYGRDLTVPTSLSVLVARLLEDVPNVRFRLGSIEATEVDDLLLDLLAGSDGRVAPHLHMPLQSGADPVLKRMRRWHTRDTYRARALEIASRLPVLGLGADIITGFPGETDADQRQTLSLVEELPYTYLHVFPFSQREGTEAASANRTSPVPQRVAGERSRELRELAHWKARAHQRSRDGIWSKVVLEGVNGTALTGDYLRVKTHVTKEVSSLRRLPSTALERPFSSPLREGKLRWCGESLTIDLTDPSGFN